MAVVTMRQLLESGVHFGHQTRRWNPKMKRSSTERNGIYIIDLQQSITHINSAYEFVRETVAHGGSILFVGTKKQAQEPVAEQATRVGCPMSTTVGSVACSPTSDDLQALHPPQRNSRRSTSTRSPGPATPRRGCSSSAREGQAGRPSAASGI